MRPATLSLSLPLIGGLTAVPAGAATLNVTLPKLAVAEYHRPYVAAWIEPVGGGQVRHLFAWYDVKKNGAEAGTKWLNELRTWWRKGGRSLKFPADGISGATRAPGTYAVPLPANLAPGNYIVNVEAARETAGRELVSVPLTIPAKAAAASGKTELGAVSITLR
jgi:hypothetical protein